MERELITPLGPMIAAADDQALYSLQFGKTSANDSSPPLLSIEEELKLYFEGKLKKFTTPIAYPGTSFQRKVWEELQRIPFGETCSYAELAERIGREGAYRAVARANATNQLAIIIPCHRVIYADGSLGGYAGGLEYKKGLLNHEMLWRG